jgi:hypothetical protein
MIAQLLQSRTACRFAAAALSFAFILGAATPASADASQWTRAQPHWWEKSGGWDRQGHWHSQRHHRKQFGCFGCGTRVIIGGSGVVFSRPGIIVGNPGFIVRQPGFVVGQPRFVVRQPNFIFERPAFAAKQRAFFKRHPSLHLGQPWWGRKHKHWKHTHWKHKAWKPWKHHRMGGTRLVLD